MDDKKKEIYRYDENISFRVCDLANKINSLVKGDCTCFYDKEENWITHYYCTQYGIHLHCTKHPEFELELEYQSSIDSHLKCPKCNEEICIESLDILLKNCMKLLNIPKFKGAKLIRLDDWYIPEIKEKIEIESNYWIQCDVKTDKDGDTIIVLYVGNKDSKNKSQFFIKPEKLQLSSDHKDLDPATILSKIEVTLNNRKLIQEYDDNESK
jgi:hypothetical protein